MAQSVYEFSVKDISGEELALQTFAGQVLLIVNTASECGFTKQYSELESLYKQYKDQGLVVLGCPCNQFGGQEPGSDADIVEFCQLNFGVTFPLSQKLEVNGAQAHPLFQYLKHQAPGLLGSEKIKWNFTKFLVNRQGQVVERYATVTKPEKLSRQIETLLAQ